jgi:hypothetical protein
MSRLSIHSLFRCAALAALLIGLETGIVAQEPRGGPAEERLVRQTYLRLSLLHRLRFDATSRARASRHLRRMARLVSCLATSVPDHRGNTLTSSCRSRNIPCGRHHSAC